MMGNNANQAQQKMPLKSQPPTVDLLGTPPFEKPVISQACYDFFPHLTKQVLRNFVEFKYGKAPEAKQKVAEKIMRTFLNGVNRHELAPPSVPANTYEISINDRIYQLNYKRWRHYCKGTSFKKPPLRMSEIFGRTILKSIIQVSVS